MHLANLHHIFQNRKRRWYYFEKDPYFFDQVLQKISIASEDYLLSLLSHLFRVRASGSGKYGALKGGALALWRILRCNPFSKADTIPFRNTGGFNIDRTIFNRV